MKFLSGIIEENTRRFFHFLKPYKWRVGLILGLTLVQSVVGMSGPYITKLFIDDVLQEKNITMLYWLIAASLGVFFIGKILGFLNQIASMVVGERLFFDIGLKLTEKILRLPLNFHKQHGVGYLISRITDDIDSSQGLLQSSIIGVVSSFFTFCAGIFILFGLNVKLACVTLAVLPIYVYALRLYDGDLSNKSQKIQESMAKELEILQEILSAQYTLSIFNRMKYELRKLVRYHKTVIKSRFSLFYSQFAIGSILEFVGTLSPLLLMWFGVQEIYNGTLTIGDYFAFTAYIGMLFGPVSNLVNLNITLRTVSAPIDRIFEIFDMDEQITEINQPKPFSGLQKNIVFRNVEFGYPEKENWKISELDLSVSKGETVAFVGRSGSGKTSISNLLIRFYDVDNGEILLDGVNVKHLKLSELRKGIGYVSQDPFLFNDSIYNNIRYGSFHSTKEQIIDAAKRANCYDFIMSFPEQFETVCGERGVSLSGGQKQRVSIARAILKDPSILILDEATSALDSHSEQAVHDAIENIIRDRTTIIISHRLSTVKSADRIYVMDNGKLIEEGTHYELVSKSGAYAELCSMQNIMLDINEN